jgi:hypothetical protein
MKNIFNKVYAFSLDHETAFALILLSVIFSIFILGYFFAGTAIGKIVAALIVVPFVILVIAELCGKIEHKE